MWLCGWSSWSYHTDDIFGIRRIHWVGVHIFGTGTRASPTVTWEINQIKCPDVGNLADQLCRGQPLIRISCWIDVPLSNAPQKNYRASPVALLKALFAHTNRLLHRAHKNGLTRNQGKQTLRPLGSCHTGICGFVNWTADRQWREDPGKNPKQQQMSRTKAYWCAQAWSSCRAWTCQWARDLEFV